MSDLDGEWPMANSKSKQKRAQSKRRQKWKWRRERIAARVAELKKSKK